MAGDIGIRERAIILGADAADGPRAQRAGSTADRMAAAVPPEATGRVRHVYGARVLIAEAPQEAAASAQAARAFGAAGVEDVIEEDGTGLAPDVLRQLAPEERLGLQAFALRQSGAYAEAKANRPRDGEAWDAEGDEHAPACGEITAALEDAGAIAAQGATGEAGAPTSAQLTGTVAVGIIIVEGPTAALKFSAAERTKVVAEVQNGLGWLATQNPAGVTFVYDIKIVSITTQPGAANLSFEAKESLWRDPAMAKLGYGAGLGNVTKYVEALRTTYKTNWAYCAFFTKYPVGHFAYASIGGPRIVMDYANDGWGPDNIDRVFAHETGHIFGAPDEYASSGCSCGGSWGVYGRPNSNCANCAPGGGVECLMKGNTWNMCVHTPYHLGFPLVDQTYAGVWRAGTGAHFLWVNASWTSFQQKWQQLAGQGLRLVNFKITRDGAVDRYHGVWRQGTGGYYLWVNASWAGFQQKWTELSGQGMRLACLDVRNVNGTLLYSGAWLPGTDAHYLWVNADWASFQQKWTQLAAQNLRLTDLRIVTVGGQQRYFGVWRHGTGGHYLWVNATWANFQQKWQQLAGQGLRLVDLEITGPANARRYSGVWLPGTDGYALWAGANWQTFRAKWEEFSAQGLRLVDLDVVPGGVAQSPTPEQAGAMDNAMDDAQPGGRGVRAGEGSLGLRPSEPARPSPRGTTAFAGRGPAVRVPSELYAGTAFDEARANGHDGAGFGGGSMGRAGGADGMGDDPATDDASDDGAGFGGGDVGGAMRAGSAGDAMGDGRGDGGGDLAAAASGADQAEGFGVGDLTLAPDADDQPAEDGMGGGVLR